MTDKPHESAKQSPITARQLGESERLDTLPRHFGGRGMLQVEFSIYDALRELADGYRGGYWHYYQLSNGGFYMAPDTDTPFRLSVAGNGFSGSLSADATGIVASLFGINRIAHIPDQRCIEHYYLLRDFALLHAEQSSIFRAID